MSRIGWNSFFWPARHDIIWYSYDSDLTLIPQPSMVTHRHIEIDQNYWSAICLKLRVVFVRQVVFGM
jgi:hypothetical protein